jgi:excisionase family DNA binding protein
MTVFPPLLNFDPEAIASKGRSLELPWTIPKLAEELGVCTKTIRRWIAAGKAPTHFRGSGRILFEADDVHAWLDQRGGSGDRLR